MNLLYKLGVMLAMLIISITGNSQSKSYRIYESYGNEEGFTSFSFSKSMLNSVDLKLDDENKKVTGDFHELRILLFNPKEGSMKNNFRKEMSLRLNNMNYKRVEPEGQDDSEDVEFWIEGNGHKVKECHVIVQEKNGNDFGCLVSFYGDFTVEDLRGMREFSRNQLK